MEFTGTRRDINPENASRFFVANMDESREQTRRIHRMQRRVFKHEELRRGKYAIPEVMKIHRAAQRLLKNIFVEIPYADDIDFPDVSTRSRRDYFRFLGLIACVAYVRQYQKEILRDGEFEFIMSDFIDYGIAYEILMSGVLTATMHEFSQATVEFYEGIRGLARKLAKKRNVDVHEVTFDQREIREHNGYSQTWVKQQLRGLVDYEYIVLVRGGKERSKGLYRLRADEPLEKIDLSMIPAPDDLQRRIEVCETNEGKAEDERNR